MIVRFVGGPLGGREDRRDWARVWPYVEAVWDVLVPVDAPAPMDSIDLRAVLVRYTPVRWSDGTLTYAYDAARSAPNPNPVACVE